MARGLGGFGPQSFDLVALGLWWHSTLRAGWHSTDSGDLSNPWEPGQKQMQRKRLGPHYPPVRGVPLKAELLSIKPHFLRLPLPCKCAIRTVVTRESGQ